MHLVSPSQGSWTHTIQRGYHCAGKLLLSLFEGIQSSGNKQGSLNSSQQGSLETLIRSNNLESGSLDPFGEALFESSEHVHARCSVGRAKSTEPGVDISWVSETLQILKGQLATAACILLFLLATRQAASCQGFMRRLSTTRGCTGMGASKQHYLPELIRARLVFPQFPRSPEKRFKFEGILA